MTLYEQIGGQSGCRHIAEAFYSHLAEEPLLVAIYPRHVRCATEAIAWFLEELTGGPSEHANHTMYASLGESHLRFRIGENERDAWLRNMERALIDCAVGESIREDLLGYFRQAMTVIVNSPIGHGAGNAKPPTSEWAAESWSVTQTLEQIAAALKIAEVGRAIVLIGSPIVAEYLAARPSAHARILALLCSTDDDRARSYTGAMLERTPALITATFSGGRNMLHLAAMNGAPKVAALLVGKGARADVADFGGHCALYALANNAAGNADLVPLLIYAGANVNANGGVQRCTPLHMAARRGNVAIAQALLQAGADSTATDVNGVTALGRAINCRRGDVAELLRRHQEQATKN